MLAVAPAWDLNVQRGPDWLLVRLGNAAAPDASGPNDVGHPNEAPSEPRPLGEMLWALLEQHFTYRLVLECDQLGLLNSSLIAQLVVLERRIRQHGGLLRLCGLSKHNQEVLHQCRLISRFPHFMTRTDAVLGNRPTQPR